ncbi:helix-turn-helix transcriptional regulator [Streptomyces flaveus]|uniref:helix-turn-helix transcriptional regulator n=1 Tax=Streptomyces flaveus TaxID=66370 RepID=UPI001FE2E968|nr:LuxR family transcriptional regulator [Streptomyces flaveus]
MERDSIGAWWHHAEATEHGRGWRAVERVFVGRGEELAVLEGARERARAGQPQRVLVEGPEGIGKTALVRRFLAGVPHVLYAEGEDAGTGPAFGALEQLIGPVRWTDPDSAGVTLLEALQKALQKAGGVGEDAVTVVVDDAQWAGSASLCALGFAVRRLRAVRVLVVVVTRDITDPRIPEGLRRLFTADAAVRVRLEGLEPAALRALGDALGPVRLTVRAAARLCEHTGGNPLYARALLEQEGPGLVEALERSDITPPAPKSCVELALARLASCTADAEALLAAASALGRCCTLAEAAHLAGLADPLPALEQAVRTGLLTERQGDPVVRFPHPIVQAAVYHGLGPARRRALHRRAASLAEDEETALHHRACAATGPAPQLAAELAAHGRRSAAEERWEQAARHLSAAARLAPDRAAYEQYTLESVECRLLAGDVPDAAEVAERVGGFTESGWRSYLLGRLCLADPVRAEVLLRDAWRRCDPAADRGDRVLAARIAGRFAALYGSVARGTEAANWARLALRLAPEATATDTIRYLALSGTATSGGAARALAELGPLPDPAVASPAQLQELMGRGTLRVFTGDLTGALRDLAGVLAATRERKSARTAAAPTAPARSPVDGRTYSASFRITAAGALAAAEYLAGHWDDVLAHCEPALSLTDDSGRPHSAPYCRMLAALTHAARGSFAEARTQVRRMREDGGPAVWTALAGAHLARTLGRPEDVVSTLAPLLPPSKQDASGSADSTDSSSSFDEPGAVPWPDLLADAWTELGDHRRAAQLLGQYEALAVRRDHPAALMRAARSRGALAAARGESAAAESAFRSALRHAQRAQEPFGRALVHLAYGQFLRRTAKRTPAAEQLRWAQGLLVRLDARPDLERCERELAACGLGTPARGTDVAPLKADAAPLTAQELVVARKVAAGLTNRQVARELVISPKTVEFHLGRIYAKLGVASRTRLAVLLAAGNEAALPGRS